MANSPGIQFPSIPGAQQEPRIRARDNLFEKLLGNPQLMQFLLSMGANLSQPRQFGTSELQGLTESLQSGFQGLELARSVQAAREKQVREERQGAIAASNVAVLQEDTLQSRESTRALQAAQAEGLDAKTVETRRETAFEGSVEEERRRGVGQEIEQGDLNLQIAQQTIDNGPIVLANLVRDSETAETRARTAETAGITGPEIARLNHKAAMTNLALQRERLNIEKAKATLEGSISMVQILEEESKALLKLSLSSDTEMLFNDPASVKGQVLARSFGVSAGSDIARDRSVHSLVVLGITDPVFVAGRTGGMTQRFKEDGSPELENGVPIYVANREFKGAPVSGPGWDIVESPFKSKTIGKVVKAMRLQIPPDASFPQGAVFYIPTEQIVLESP